MSQETPQATLLERILAFLALTIIAVAVAAFISTLVAGLVGVSREDLAIGLWPVVTWISYVGLPVGFALIIALLLVSRRRRLRELSQDR